MPTDTAKASAGGGEQKQRKLTYTSEKFQKLIHRKDESQHGTPLGEGESKPRKMTVNSEILQKIKIKKEEGQNGRSSSKEKPSKAVSKTEPRKSAKSMGVSGGVGSKVLPLDFLQDATAAESGVSFGITIYYFSVSIHFH